MTPYLDGMVVGLQDTIMNKHIIFLIEKRFENAVMSFYGKLLSSSKNTLISGGDMHVDFHMVGTTFYFGAQK